MARGARMLWRRGRESGNIEDRRGFGGKSIGIGGLVIGAVVVFLMGGNPLEYITQNATTVTTSPVRVNPQNDDARKFAAVVLGYTEDVWNEKFAQASEQYRAPRMVLFREGVQSACGAASSASGPFYCPADEKIYLDLSFFDALSQRLGAEGDTAAAYVIAHEVGHHVQHLLGLHRKMQQADEGEKNQASVAIELQADCFAGVWAKEIETTKQVIEPGDIQEAMGAAAAVGDDRLQQQSQGHVVPDSFTHGSSEQRVVAFRAGYDSGDVGACRN